MTTQSFDRFARIQVLLNTLIGEHHVRRALLGELCDLMGDAGSDLFEARQMTENLLAELDRVREPSEFDGRVRDLASVFEHSRQSPESLG